MPSNPDPQHELIGDGGTPKPNGPITVSKRAGELEPVKPGLPSMVEQAIWALVLAGVLTAVGLYTPVKTAITAPDGSSNILLLAYVFFGGLAAARATTLLTAYRRFGLTPYDYKIAKRLAQGRAMTPEEFEQHRLDQQRENAKQLEGTVNEKIRRLNEMEVVESVAVWGNEVEATLRDRSEAQNE